MKKLVGIIGLAAALCCGAADAQDIHYSQFYENSVLRNPALTGIFSGDYKAGVNFRNQWSSLATPFVTLLASAETRIIVNKETGDCLSIGLTATMDKAGAIDFTTFQAYGAINYNKALEDEHNSYLSVGFAGGYVQRNFDPSRITVSNQFVNGSYSASNPTGENFQQSSFRNFDLAAGVSLNSSLGEQKRTNYYLGVAAYHLTQPKAAFNGAEQFVNLKMRWSGNFGLQAYAGEHLGITFHVNYQYQQPYQELLLGGLLGFRGYDPSSSKSLSVYGGLFYRYGDALIPTIRLEYNRTALTVSYDANTSPLRTASQGVGGVEVSLFARGVYRHREQASDQYRCPQFENLPGAFGQTQ